MQYIEFMYIFSQERLIVSPVTVFDMNVMKSSVSDSLYLTREHYETIGKSSEHYSSFFEQVQELYPFLACPFACH